MIILFCLIAVLLFTLFSLPTIYQFQIKEYYYARVIIGLRERNSFFIPFRRPAFTPRNFLIIGFVLFALLLYYYLLYFYFETLSVTFVIFWALGFLFSKIAAAIGMLLTEPLAAFRRSKVVRDGKKKRDESLTIFVGVTGSYGKSSVKEFIAQLLKSKYKVGCTPDNRNTDVGIALSLLKDLKDDTDFYIAEMGAYNLGSIERSSDLVEPKYGFITGVGNQHLALFGSKSNLIEAKSELIEALPADGKLYINKDFPESGKMAKRAQSKVVTYSIQDKQADMYAEFVKKGNVRFQYKGKIYNFVTELDIDHHLLNLAGAVAFALDMGCSEEELSPVIRKAKPSKQKLEKIPLRNGKILLNDSYNSNSAGFMNALNYLQKLSGNKKVVFTRGIIELGEGKSTDYLKILRICADSDIKIVSTDKYFSNMNSVGAKVQIVNEAGLDEQFTVYSKDYNILLEGRFSPRFLKKVEEYYE